MNKRGKAFVELCSVIQQLRDPETGCPWDKKQTHQSLRPYVVEEAYEVVEAIEQNPRELASELGDLLLQILLHSQIASEENRFNIDDVVQALHDKMITRHPHIFSDEVANTAEDVVRRWNEIKNSKSGNSASLLAGISSSLPALMRAQKIGDAVARAGISWWSADDAVQKSLEELNEFLHALESGSEEDIAEELGDLIFSLVQIARMHGANGELLVQSANEKFTRRFQKLEKLADRPLDELSKEEMLALWKKAKAV